MDSTVQNAVFKSMEDLPATEQEAVTFFQEKGILPSTRICLQGHEMKLSFGGRVSWRCHRKDCRSAVTMRVGNWFENMRLPFLISLRFMYAWSRGLTSIKWCREELGIAKNTVVDWNNCLREVIVHGLQSRPTRKIGGKGYVVEVDESLFTPRKNNDSRAAPEQWLFGGLCRATKESFLVTIPNRSLPTLMEAVKENIKPGSVIYSDAALSFCATSLEEAGFSHFETGDCDEAHGQTTFERMWGSVKWRNRARRGTARYHMESYLAEFQWRQMVTQDPFSAILEEIRNFHPPQIRMYD